MLLLSTAGLQFLAGCTINVDNSGTATRRQEAEARASRQREQELGGNVEALRTAELAYDSYFDGFVACPLHPRALAELNDRAVAWAIEKPWDLSFEEQSVRGGYYQLGFAPDDDVTGTYSVVVAPDGKDFTVNGWQDLDGDGTPIQWQATKTVPAHAVESPGLFAGCARSKSP